MKKSIFLINYSTHIIAKKKTLSKNKTWIKAGVAIDANRDKC